MYREAVRSFIAYATENAVDLLRPGKNVGALYLRHLEAQGYAPATVRVKLAGARALYQALYRLEGRGLVLAEWGVTGHNRRARYYQLTEAGRAHLARETATWVRYAATVTGILTAPQPAA